MHAAAHGHSQCLRLPQLMGEAEKLESHPHFQRNDPVGTYQDHADATMNDIAGSATTSFTVQ